MKAKLSKLETASWCFAIAIVLSPIAFVIAQSLPISRFPNTPTPNDSDLFVLAQTLAPATNKNIRYDQLRGAIRSGLATESYVLITSNSLFGTSASNGSNLVKVLSGTNILVEMTSTNGTNFYAVNNAAPAGFAALENQTNGVRVGLGTNQNWTYGVTGSFLGQTFTLGIDDSLSNSNLSNALFSIITTASNTFAFNRTNQWTTNIAGTPVNGMVWFQGFPSQAFVTNNARNRTWEWEPTNQSIRIGSIGNVGFDSHHYIPVSNFWNAPNLGFLSYAFGSNNLVNADFSSVLGGVRNLIYTNAYNSFIGGGTNNSIHTNSSGSVIVGGGTGTSIGNVIQVDSRNSFIGSGNENQIFGGSINATIVGGAGNQMRSGGNSYSFIGGGVNNNIGTTGGSVSDRSAICGGDQNIIRGEWSFIGGGRLNNMLGSSDDFCAIGGGDGNTIGVAPSFPTDYAFIGGGSLNAIANSCDYTFIGGGRGNSMGGSNTNGVIAGGAWNSLSANEQFGMILGGQSNTVSGTDSFVAGGSWNSVTADTSGAVGTSNSVTAVRALAIGEKVTNSTSGSVTVGELISYNTPSVIAGAGSGSTNYLLAVTSPKMLLGSSNVNIYGVSGTIAGKTHSWSVNITNLSADVWGISFASGTNRWKFQSWMYGTNAPSVLTNNTLLRLQGESQGTNTLVTFQYFSPAL